MPKIGAFCADQPIFQHIQSILSPEPLALEDVEGRSEKPPTTGDLSNVGLRT